jgi:hypothetical protein
VFIIEPGCLLVSDKELRAVGVLARVGHGEEALLGVREPGVLVVELGPVDRQAARPVAVGRVTALHHETRDHTVEDTALVVQLRALLTRAKGSEVLGGLRDMLREKLKDYAACFWLLGFIWTT